VKECQQGHRRAWRSWQRTARERHVRGIENPWPWVAFRGSSTVVAGAAGQFTEGPVGCGVRGGTDGGAEALAEGGAEGCVEQQVGGCVQA
jgi:hypothetical protein